MLNLRVPQTENEIPLRLQEPNVKPGNDLAPVEHLVVSRFDNKSHFLVIISPMPTEFGLSVYAAVSVRLFVHHIFVFPCISV